MTLIAAAEGEAIERLPKVPDFNRLAHLYRWMEWLSFGPFLARCRNTFIRIAAQKHHALILGDGDGRFTAGLLRTSSRIRIDAVDASSEMLSELTRRSQSCADRLRTHTADARTFDPRDHDYDLVVTHFFLDCLTTAEVTNIAQRLKDQVRRDAVWLVSEFAIPQGWYGRAVARPLISILYWAFGFLTSLDIRELPEHRSALQQSGWSLVEEKSLLGGLLVSELWGLRT